MDERLRRLAQNEALFREVNERVSEVNADWTAHGIGQESFGVVCECGRDDCAELVLVTSPAYEEVRRNSARFIVLPGHELEEVERVVGRLRTYFVVEKTGAAKQYVEHVDPRSSDPARVASRTGLRETSA
jgi:hypothetical protein